MYHQYFGLTEAPFSISVNPRYLFMSPRHRDALAHLLYGVGSGGGFILLTGEVGTGKTTINRALLEQLPDNVDLAIVLNPALSAVELLATVCDELDIDYPRGEESLKVLTDALHRFLLENHQRDRKTVLMIDEAQHLDFDVLEQIRLLTNLETDSEKLLQIILIGQPELTEKLARPELRQLNQRITARYNLEPLNVDETAAYIRHRLEVAGLSGSQELFPGGVVRTIHARTRGIPRQINLLCDRALLGAYGRKEVRVNGRLVQAAAVEVFGDAKPGGADRPVWLVPLVVVGLLGAAIWAALVSGLVDRSEGELPEPVDVPEVVRTAPAPARPAWLLGEALAEQRLWQLSSDAPYPPVICAPQTVAELRCTRGTSDVWEPLLDLRRPVLLSMQTPEKFTAAALVVAFDGNSAWVATAEGMERLPLVALASAWRGGYAYLWRPTEGWQQPLGVGDSGAAVAAVARWFATLDGQDTPLTIDRFTDALAARVTLFQESVGLTADGVVGEQTVLRLNEAVGRALTPAKAIERARWFSGEP